MTFSFLFATRPVGVVLLILLACSLHAKEEGKTLSENDVVTLEQAYDRALATDQSIRIAYWEVRKANLLPWSALTRIGPQLSAGLNYSRREQTSFSSLAPSLRTRSGTGSANITLQQPLIDFTVFPAYRLGKLSKTSARLQQQFTIRETLFGVATAYYEVLKQRRLVEVNHETLRLAGVQLDYAQKRANAGEVTRADVLRAQVTVETARRTVVESENLLDMDRNTIGNILNFPPNARFTLVEPPNYPPTLPAFEALLAQAYTHREDLKVKAIAVDQDIARRGEIVGEYGPRMVAQFDADTSHRSGTSSQSDRDWQAAISVQIPILTGGQREIDLRSATEQIQQTKLESEQAVKSAESEVKTAWLSVRSLQQTLKALQAQVIAAEQAYKDVENQYKEGTATAVDAQSALNDLNTARKDLAVETYAYQIALRALEQTSGVFQEKRVRESKIR